MGPVARAWRVLATEGILALVGRGWRRFTEGPRRGALSDRQYARWLAERRRTAPPIEALREAARQLPYRPLVSVIMPVHDIAEAWLRRALDSVRAQVYSDWELCVVDDAAPSPAVRRLLDEYAAGEARVQVTHLSSNLGIAGASNVGLRMATGEFVGFLDHDDELSPDALLEVVQGLNARPATDLVYTDEDKIEPDGRRVEPFFKPDWCPDLLLSMNYIGHLVVCRRRLVEAVGGFRVRARRQSGSRSPPQGDRADRADRPRAARVVRLATGSRLDGPRPSTKPAATAAGAPSGGRRTRARAESTGPSTITGTGSLWGAVRAPRRAARLHHRADAGPGDPHAPVHRVAGDADRGIGTGSSSSSTTEVSRRRRDASSRRCRPDTEC